MFDRIRNFFNQRKVRRQQWQQNKRDRMYRRQHEKDENRRWSGGS